jgi:hypothetical protein
MLRNSTPGWYAYHIVRTKHRKGTMSLACIALFMIREVTPGQCDLDGVLIQWKAFTPENISSAF